MSLCNKCNPMDVRKFMPVSETIRTKTKKQTLRKQKSQTLVESHNMTSHSGDFEVVLNTLIQQTSPKTSKGKQNKVALKDEKMTKVSQDIYDKYRRTAGIIDSTVDGAQWIKKNLFDNCRIKPKTLYRILNYYNVIKHDMIAMKSLVFSKIIKKPFNFLNSKYQFLSFKKCEFIMDVYKLRNVVEKSDISNGYIFDKFLGENAYYLPQWKFIHKSQTKKMATVEHLVETKSELFPYKYDMFQDEFYETLAKHGIYPNDDEIRFGKDKILALQKVKNSKNVDFWTTERFLELERSYGSLLIQEFGNEQKTRCPYKKNAIKEWIKTIEMEKGITLNPEQVKAVNTVLRYKLTNISGYPGTGKSTIVDFIVRFRQDIMDMPTCLMAPTAKAVKSLMTKLGNNGHKAGTGPLIATCQKFVYNIFSEYEKKKTNPEYEFKDSLLRPYKDAGKNPFDTIIIDESSMIDFDIFKEIIDFVIKYGSNIIFVGDIHQLPPVSAGRPYECIYKSGLFKCVELQQIMRSTGNISKFVLDLNANKFSNLSSYFDGREIKYYDATDFSESYFKTFFKKIIINESDGLQGFKMNYSIISAQNGSENGEGRDWDGSVNQLNLTIQALCLEIKQKENDEMMKRGGDYEEIISVSTNKRVYYDGDRVIRTVNDYSNPNGKIRVNGELGTLQMRKQIQSNNTEKIIISVRYDNSDNKNEPDIEDNLDEFDLEDNFNLAYASTVHKMQGSENKNIIVVMSNQHYMWKGEGCKKLLYTAVSRAKEQLSIISLLGAFDESLKFCKKPEKSFHSEFLIKN